jgi:hypothetical protein
MSQACRFLRQNHEGMRVLHSTTYRPIAVTCGVIRKDQTVNTSKYLFSFVFFSKKAGVGTFSHSGPWFSILIFEFVGKTQYQSSGFAKLPKLTKHNNIFHRLIVA